MSVESVRRRIDRNDILHQLAVSTIRSACWRCPKAHAVLLGIAEDMRMKREDTVDEGRPNTELAVERYGEVILKRCSVEEGVSLICMPGNSPSVGELQSFD